jgi:hypothetical protein
MEPSEGWDASGAEDDDRNSSGGGGPQGYTPLIDYDREEGQDHTMMLSAGPGAEPFTTVFSTNGPLMGDGEGVYFADLSTVLAGARMSGAQLEDDQENDVADPRLGDGERIDGDDREGQGQGSFAHGDVNFRAIADRALAALDHEYVHTVAAAASSSAEPMLQRYSEIFVNTATMGSAHGRLTKEEDQCTALSDDWNGIVKEEKPPHSPVGNSPAAQDFFVANFDDDDRLSDDSEDATALESNREHRQPNERLEPTVDLDAVRRAVRAIRGKGPGFDAQLPGWEAEHYHAWGLVLATAPLRHPIIPPAPLSAFRKAATSAAAGSLLSATPSSKAKAATAKLSRSATIAEALRRLDLLQSQERFVIHVIGCDGAECESEGRIRELFGPVAAWIGSYSEAPSKLEIVLLGPNIPSSPRSAAADDATLSVNLDRPASHGRLESVEIRCCPGLYHEYLSRVRMNDTSESRQTDKPSLIVAFQAGIWGYAQWEPTLVHLARQSHEVPIAVTAYTIQEAEDDAEVIERVLATEWTGDPGRARSACAWSPEWNPYASQQPRETATAPPGRVYRENAAWSCWRI